MPRLPALIPVLTACILAWAPGRCHAVEDWADTNLKVTAGLELWLDAGRLPAAAKAGLHNGDAVAVWDDASGHKRHVVQSVSSSRPIYRTDVVRGQPGQAVVYFDGQESRLAASRLGKSLRDVTVFIVATPQSNAGDYRAFLALSQTGKNDYTTGLNIDQGHDSRDRFDQLNIEGHGFSGEQNLLAGSFAFGAFHMLTLSSTPDKEGTRLYVDGRPGGRRPRTAGTIRMDEVRIGCRSADSAAGPVADTGFFDGCIAEVLVYSRVLKHDERVAVEKYLRGKYAGLLKLKGQGTGLPVHFLAPGFTVRELPVRLTNINGLTYAPDGRLFALGYDGRIHVLRDTDGDGLEDRADIFWDKPTLRTPIAMAWRPEGLYVVSNSKVSLFHTDKDGRAEREDVVVKGWVKDDGTTGGGVDALGLAFDAKDNLYFGVGCADYTNAYRIKNGQAHYDLKSERGTILKVSPNRKRREIVCTGIRFPYALAFNRHGDLFCTDQEGETWLPGGNPLDELNHIIPGRHYGFPPRHPKYLPDVHDEPPVVAFSPQHQSSCGLKFNEARPGWKAFGPAGWEGDALVAGFSRGKIWRVRLVKTPAGYVGRPTLIAALKMLALDLAVSPQGDLVVTCHSGAPDWGSGPGGPGRLFKISYNGRAAPQPVAAWAANPLEVRVAFDRPVPASFLDPGRARIVFGEHVRAADRYEVLRPGYATVAAQQRAYRGRLAVAAARLSPDRRALILATDPHPMNATYALTLPLRPSAKQPDEAIDLAYDLTGAEASWTSNKNAVAPWSGWLPHLDLDVAHALTAGSAEHEQLHHLLKRSGRLMLKTRLQLPAGQVFLRLTACAPIDVETSDQAARSAAGKDGHEAAVRLASKGRPIDLRVSLRTGTGAPAQLHVSYHTADDPTERPLPLERVLLPWAPAAPPAADVPTGPPPELAGGDWRRGEAIFFGKEANCAACHRIGSKGGAIGPDLSNLVHRDAASVLRDIVEPSAAINPDYIAYLVELKDGRVLTGTVRTEADDKVRVFGADAAETVVPRSAVERLQARTVSLMPQGYAEQLGEERLRDLLTFLTTSAPAQPAQGKAPPPRSRAEVEAVLRGSASPAADSLRTLNIVLVAGPQDHGPGEHDYPAWQRKWKALLAKAPRVRVSTAFGWPDRGHWDLADVIVFYFWNHDWTTARYKQLDAFLARGGGVVALHSATIEDKDPEKLARRLGLAFQPGKSKYRHGPLDLHILSAKQPITRGLKTSHFVDETYWPMFGKPSRVHVLATAVEEDKAWPMLWTYQPGKGRVFGSVLGHYTWTYDDPLFRVLVLRGLAWAAGEPVDRFNALVTEGVKLAGTP